MIFMQVAHIDIWDIWSTISDELLFSIIICENFLICGQILDHLSQVSSKETRQSLINISRQYLPWPLNHCFSLLINLNLLVMPEKTQLGCGGVDQVTHLPSCWESRGRSLTDLARGGQVTYLPGEGSSVSLIYLARGGWVTYLPNWGGMGHLPIKAREGAGHLSTWGRVGSLATWLRGVIPDLVSYPCEQDRHDWKHYLPWHCVSGQ